MYDVYIHQQTAVTHEKTTPFHDKKHTFTNLIVQTTINASKHCQYCSWLFVTIN